MSQPFVDLNEQLLDGQALGSNSLLTMNSNTLVHCMLAESLDSSSNS